MEQTKNYKLNKPGQDDFYNVEDFNQNADILDQALKELAEGGSDQYVSKTGDTMTGELDFQINDCTLTVGEGGVSGRNNIHSMNKEKNTFRPLSIGCSELIFSNGSKITNLGTPTSDFDAANKKYVDDNAGGKRTCRFVVGTSTAGWTKKDCDYLCDGTDDQVEIQAAINALPYTGGEVVVLDGTYNITKKINIQNPGLKLIGCGKGTKLQRMANSEGDLYGLIDIRNNDIQVSNFYIFGNNQNFKDGYNCGITIDKNYGGILISDNYFEYHQNNMLYLKTGLVRSKIVNNIFDDTFGSGIFLGKNDLLSQGVVISGNNFLYCRASGIDLNYCQGSSVFGNTFWRNGYGIRLGYNAKNNTISGNSCFENNYHGISCDITQNVNFIEGNTISGNTCFNNLVGINLKGCNKNTIVGNTCIRGTGLPSDYTSTQHTIRLEETNNNYNLIANNNLMGKNYVSGGDANNTFVNNKYN